MFLIQRLIFTALALFIIMSCGTTGWQPTAIHHPESDSIQQTEPKKGEFIVMLYSTDWCYWCKVAKKWMTKEKIKFVERDYDDPEEKKKLMDYAKTIGYAGNLDAVPIFVIGTKIIVGYNPKQVLCEIGRTKCKTSLFSTWRTPLKQD